MINKIKNLVSFNSALSFSIFLFVIIMLTSLGVARSLQGTNSADDAWIALSAKNLSSGKGYSTSISNEKQILYDPFISTGPVLVVPTSLAIGYFGNEGWVPGVTQLLVYISQIILITLLLSKFFGWRNALFYVATLNFILIYVSFKFWMFGVLIGEPVAFGFLLLGIIFIGVSSSYLAAILGAFCLALAFLTKQISLFPILGIFTGLLIFKAFDFNNVQLRSKNLVLMSFVITTVVGVFELVKLVQLGFKGYRETIVTTTKFGINLDGNSVGLIERVGRFLDVLNFYYSPSLISVVLLLVAYSLIFFLKPRASLKEPIFDIKAFKILMLLIFSLGALFFYVCFISPRIWERYLWIGISLFFAALLVFLLISTFKQRFVFLVIFILLFISFSGIEPLKSRINYSIDNADSMSSNRDEIVRFLDEHKDVPYAADYWTSIFDIVYLRKNEGVWRFGQDVEDLNGSFFYAIINYKYTHKDWNFYKYVSSLCQPLIISVDYGLHSCDQSFWANYRNY